MKQKQKQNQMFSWNSCFYSDPTYVGNLISGSSAFSKFSLNIGKFTIHILLKPVLENFKHYFTSVWDEYNCVEVWIFFGIVYLWDWNESWPFPVLWPLLSLQIRWHIGSSTLIASPFRAWNSSAGIPSPPLALFTGILPRPTWLHFRMAGSRWVVTPSWLSGHDDLFCIFLLCIFVTSS